MSGLVVRWCRSASGRSAIARRTPLAAAALLLGACGAFGGRGTPAPPTPLPDPQVSVVAAPNPEEAASRFLQAWQARDYPAMYAMLSPLTRDAISEQAFVDRYEEIRGSIGLTGLDFEVVSSLVLSPRQAQVRFRANLQSAAVGPIPRDYLMDLSRSQDDWGVAWSDALILPELNGGQGIFWETVTPVRANIYDRNGLALAAGSEAAALWIVPNQIGDEEAEGLMLSTLRRLLDYPSDESIQALYDALRETDFRINLGEVPLEELNQVSGTLGSVGGVQWRTYDTRFYFAGGLAPHAVGYVSWIQEAQLEGYKALGYRGDEFVGQIGLERAYESQLRGVPGGTLYLTDASGRPTEPIASRDPEPPYAVYTTLDRDLQRYAQQAIEDSDLVGAVVVLERDTGAVLAMASSPGFDPNLFDTDNPNSSSGLAELFQQANNPLLNRATLAALPPGSVFKIVTMAAALESGFYEPDTVYDCGLEFRELPGIVLYDWRFERELPAAGEITLEQALELSCNPYFFHIGLDLYNRGLPEAIPDMAKAFGLGQPTGIELDEAAGQVPDPESKQEQFGEAWSQSDPVQLAIGQSFLQVTPLQVARFVAAVGNGGTLYRPQIVRSVQNAEGEVLQAFTPEAQGTLPLSPETLAAIQQAMVGVVREGRVVRNLEGTAYRRFLGLAVDLAGKTGTAQSGPFTDPHAWFAGYTFEGRADKPDIAVVVMLEFQGEGSEWAAPVFRRVVEAYFLGRPISPYPWEARLRVPRTPEPPEEEGEATATPEP
jgi:penicillin-binding protein 2